MWVGIALAITVVSVLIIGAIYRWCERTSVSQFSHSIVFPLQSRKPQIRAADAMSLRVVNATRSTIGLPPTNAEAIRNWEA